MPPPPMRPLTLGEVLDVAFGLYRAKFAPLLVIAVVCRLLPILLAVYFEVSEPTVTILLLQLAATVVSLVLAAIAVAASTHVVSDAYLGLDTTAESALSRAMPMVGTLIGVSLLTSLAVGVGILFLIVPGLIVLAGFLLSPVVVVIERPGGSIEAMRRSWALSKGFKGKVLLTMVVAFLLLLVPSIALAGIGGMVGLAEGERLGLLFFVIPLILQVFVYPFVYVVQTVLYYDLRIRKEGFDLELLASSLGSN